MAFEVGDKVKLIKTDPDYEWMDQRKLNHIGTITKQYSGLRSWDWVIDFDGKINEYYEWQLEKVESEENKSYSNIMTGTFETFPSFSTNITVKAKRMSLLKKLLNPDLAIIEEYCMDECGNLDFELPLVQQALMETPGFKDALVKLCKEAKKNEF